MAISGTRSVGRFEIVRKSTYASYAEVYRKSLKSKQASALTNAANTLYGTITTESAGLFQVAVQQAVARTQEKLAATVADITV